jgi:hypothetical protein
MFLREVLRSTKYPEPSFPAASQQRGKSLNGLSVEGLKHLNVATEHKSE